MCIRDREHVDFSYVPDKPLITDMNLAVGQPHGVLRLGNLLGLVEQLEHPLGRGHGGLQGVDDLAGLVLSLIHI